MQLKEYQTRVLDELTAFLSALSEARQERQKRLNHDDEYVREAAQDKDFVEEAWQKTKGLGYFSQRDGLGEPLPDVYLKVPTGGGKTLLACHAIGGIQHKYLNRQNGLVLWIVPTQQIYQQTLEKLADRAHPYRQILDIASGGRTLIRERGKPLKPADIDGNLVVLMLMLPAANRETKELLRMFRDSGGYDTFFPDDSDYEAHRQLLKEVPNLDVFEDDGIFSSIVKSSLGNVIKICRPLVIMDEGHRGTSERARQTLCDFNPAFMLELSATPPNDVCIIAAASGRDLDKEEMIKLDIRLSTTPSTDWKDTLLAAINKQKELEKKAIKFRQNSNRYIRPIVLIQVERTGSDQRGRRWIHAEDAKEYLLTQGGIRPEHVAIKSSNKDDIEGIDLLSDECHVRYIITKSALQEGWDCSFAYVLAVLTNPNAGVGMTQLVGRVLRQPDASKTKVPALDECYVYTRRNTAGEIINAVRQELNSEGLGDLSGRLTVGEGVSAKPDMIDVGVSKKFKQFDGRIYLPQFIIVQKGKVRQMDYFADILGNIEWNKIWNKSNQNKLKNITLDNSAAVRKSARIGLSDKVEPGDDVIADGLEAAPIFMTRQLIDVVPNPWRAYKISCDILDFFRERDGEEKVAANFVFIIEQSKRLLGDFRDKLAYEAFNRLIEKGELQFVLLTGEGGWRIPSKIKVYRDGKQLVRDNNSSVERTLFDPVVEDDFNNLEKQVALYMDEQEKLLWWYRNRARLDYRMQGWKPHRIYPDFIAAKGNKSGVLEKVAVIETKGLHLKNEDTAYKESVFKICGDLCKSLTVRDLNENRADWKELGLNFEDNRFLFQVVHQEEWQSVINRIFT